MHQVKKKLIKLKKKFKQSKKAISRVEQIKSQLTSRQYTVFQNAKTNKKCFHSKIKRMKHRISSLKKMVKQFQQMYQKHTNEMLASLSKCRKNLKKIKTCHVSKKYFKGLPKNLYGLLRSLDVKFACLKKSKGSDKLNCMNK
ncbi:predicted protein [Naegleria gruberi]|uniref:Predicted protein n=1 Tax=Naegleria gruberi TaxID=5762 RepID=D2VKP5_NAEGR|nr:uncharacterized protein NAEGRDRAFT_69466 [Naegleria gruberi]EFC42727.1 predicted protein [Naegleria gruberi]|eukprot:XP_002675471.1 predicted protein [Naegleria gruberi strain NEG-M]